MIESKHSLVVGVLWLVALLPLTTFAQDTRLIDDHSERHARLPQLERL